MKMIYKTFAVTLLLIVNACATSDNDPNLSLEKTETNQSKASDEEQNGYAYLEELHFIHLMTEYGGDHPLIDTYEDLFEELAAGIKPGSGCPSPAPCDPNTNCKAYVYNVLKGFRSFSQMEEVGIDVYNNNGQIINEISDVYLVECPKPKSSLYNLVEPLDGDGYFNVRFASEYTDGEMVEFQVPFVQE